jgi:TolB-like protein/DNA-binding SARP family transcriptional activator/Flp pilus assembly protein TadD
MSGSGRIRVATLGRLRIEREGEELRELPLQPVRCALLVYLAIEGSATRDELTALFWPDRDTSLARHSLSQTLYELRRRLGDHVLASRGERIQAGPDVEVDVVEFMAAVDADRDDHAFAVFGGPFLEGSHLGLTPAFESWVDGRRAVLARRFRQLCGRLTSARAGAGDLEGALAVARRWIELDPLDDEAHHTFIELLARAGRRADALRHYEAYSASIDRELGVQPLDETRDLVARIREGVDGAPGPRPTGPVPAPEPVPAPAPVDVPATVPAGVAAPWRRGTVFLAAVGTMVALAGTAFLLRDGAPAAGPTLAMGVEGIAPGSGLAVLPFLNMSPDPDHAYFSDGITEDLLARVSRIDGLRVISRTSVWRYKDSQAAVAEIARDLGVAHILEGSVRREGNRVRITAQLIDAARDDHIWAETYDRELTDIFEVQSDIAGHIAQALAQRLTPTPTPAPTAQGERAEDAARLTAYDLLLRGREYLNRRGDTDVTKYPLALGLFRRALEVDPDYARGHAAVSETYRRHILLPLIPTRADSMLAYSTRAVALDPDLPAAATELGFAFFFSGQRDRAEAELRRALALDPNQADAMEGLAGLAAINGRLIEAVRWQRQAVANDPLAHGRIFGLARYHFDIGDLDAADAALARAVELAPDDPNANFLLAQVHRLRGDPARADARMRTLLELAPDHPGVHVALALDHAYAGRFEAAELHLERTPAAEFGAIRSFRALVAKRLGHQDRADELIQQPAAMFAEWEAAGHSAPPRGQLYVHIIRDDLDGALDILREHWRTGLRWIEDPPAIGIYFLDHLPVLDPLRHDPRFQDLVAQIRAELDAARADPG